jgi:hypothetical protein
VDHRADIYAVGAILYQAVTGRRPFDGPDMMATLASVLSEEPERPCTLNPSLPPALELTIQRAMAKNPAERQRSMRVLDAELAAFDRAARRVEQTDDAPTLPLATGAGSTANLDAAQGVRRARLQIVLLSLLAIAWLSAGLLDAATTSLRWIRGDTSLSSTELFLICAGSSALLLAPLIAWVRYVAQRVWPSSPRAVELVASLRRVLIASFVGYGIASLGIRFFQSIVQGDPLRLTWPGWALAATAVALVAAALVVLAERWRARSIRRRVV